MTYNQLQSLLEKKRITVKEVFEICEMSYMGFKTAMENQTLPIKKVVPLCNFLGISPNEFFGYNDDSTAISNNAVQIGGTANMLQYEQKTVDILKEQLETKDEQIQQLLNILNKQHNQ